MTRKRLTGYVNAQDADLSWNRIRKHNAHCSRSKLIK